MFLTSALKTFGKKICYNFSKKTRSEENYFKKWNFFLQKLFLYFGKLNFLVQRTFGARKIKKAIPKIFCYVSGNGTF